MGRFADRLVGDPQVIWGSFLSYLAFFLSSLWNVDQPNPGAKLKNNGTHRSHSRCPQVV